MSPWWALLPAAVVLMLGSWLSYHKEFKESGWFVWSLIGLYVANGWLWAWAARRAESNGQLYAVSVAWDVITLTAYNVLPLVVVGVKLSAVQWVGFVGFVCSACLIKWGG